MKITPTIKKPVPEQPEKIKDIDTVNREAEKEVYEEHEIHSAAQHLMEAATVKQNPGLHKLALEHLSKKKKAINSISDLKKLAKQKDLEPDDAA